MGSTLWQLKPPGRLVRRWTFTVLANLVGDPELYPCYLGVLRDGAGRLFVGAGIWVNVLVPGRQPLWQTVVPEGRNGGTPSATSPFGPSGQVFVSDNGNDTLVEAVQVGGTWQRRTVYQFDAGHPRHPDDGPGRHDLRDHHVTERSRRLAIFQKTPTQSGATLLTSVPAAFGRPVGVTPDGLGQLLRRAVTAF